MAAAAYDVAVLALKGPGTAMNFPNSFSDYPSRKQEAEPKPEKEPGDGSKPVNEESSSSSTNTSSGGGGGEFVDEEALLNMPNLLVNMAQGMLVSPPTINAPSSHDSAGDSDGECLWSYTYKSTNIGSTAFMFNK
ncbi:AP2/ERF domain containing protein, partial [Parasponia andersonii]